MATLDIESPSSFENLTSCGFPMDSDCMGRLEPADDALDDVEELRRRMAESGYLFIRGLLDQVEVMEARREVTRRLAAEGWLDERFDPMEAVAHPERELQFKPDLARDNPALSRLLYQGRMEAFFTRFLGGSIRHFDFTWFRAVSPGKATPSHCDIVYMGRGTTNLYTAWTPIGDVPIDAGPLMVLEGSHRHEGLRNTYGKMDVDSYCENRSGAGRRTTGGWLSKNPEQIRGSLGGTWRTAGFKAGDVLVFSMYTVHASLDNRTNRVRLTSDSRYQLASEPADERWVGKNPVGHSKAGKRGRIC